MSTLDQGVKMSSPPTPTQTDTSDTGEVLDGSQSTPPSRVLSDEIDESAGPIEEMAPHITGEFSPVPEPELKQGLTAQFSTDSFGLLPPEDGSQSLGALMVEKTQRGGAEDDLTRDTTSPRVAALGLDAVTPQPVSLTPNPSRPVEESGGGEAVEAPLGEELRSDPPSHHAQDASLPPADLDLLSSGPPVASELTPLSFLGDDTLDAERSPLPRVFEGLSNQRKLSDKSCRKLEAFVASLETARGANVLIVIKGHPDPDSIGSASALQYCYREFEIQSSILYFDEISHPENRALVKAIEMEMIQYTPDFNFELYQYLSFVDSQDATINGYDMTKLPPILTFIDHHKETGKVQADFIDIREDLGATSTILAEYLEYIPELSLQKSLATHAYIATALMHGIRTDTDDLMLASVKDFFAAGYLRQFVDRDLLRMVSKQSVTARTMEIITKGLNNKIIKGTFLLAGVGFVREEDRDGIAQTADFLIRHEGVETAVVFGIVSDKFVDGSLRTSSATVDPDRWLKELFGQDDTGRPFGGGRRNKGGFRVPLGLLGRSPNRKALWQLGEQTIRDIIFEKIGEKDDDDDEGKSG